MTTTNKFLDIFATEKPLIGMLHLKGESHDEVYDRMKKEVEIYVNNGVDCLIVEDYFGTYRDMERALDYVTTQHLPIPYGVNCLNVDQMGFSLAETYHAAFVQLDSVVGHVKPRDEESIAAFFEQKRQEYQGAILGGVRFKYQPVLSANDESTDLGIAMTRCDAICVTGEATGEKTPIAKIKRFRQTLGNFPLIIGAGVNSTSLREQFKYADGAIVGSYFKQNHDAGQEVSVANVKELVAVAKQVRKELSL